jgi:hypothetical protein
MKQINTITIISKISTKIEIDKWYKELAMKNIDYEHENKNEYY